jgi:hypothetical protein
MSRKFDALMDLTSVFPNVTLRSALEFVNKWVIDEPSPETFDLDTASGLAAFARTQPQVMQFLPDRKVTAVKELRAVTNKGLRECLDAVNLLIPPPRW